MNEFDLKKELEKKRTEIKSLEDLTEFLKYIQENCNFGYGESARSIAQASLAVAWYFADVFGITGFQAGCVMWDFILDWTYQDNKCGLKIMDYDDMLYPQYEHKYEKTIPELIWKKLQEQAKINLKESSEHAHPAVIEHWKSIANGKIPFGYKLERD